MPSHLLFALFINIFLENHRKRELHLAQRNAPAMARPCDDPGLVIRQPLGDCLLRVFNYYVDDEHKLETLAYITRFDVVRFYRSTFPYKRDKDPTLYETAIAELVKGQRDFLHSILLFLSCVPLFLDCLLSFCLALPLTWLSISNWHCSYMNTHQPV